MARGRRKKADTGLIVSLACGMSVETAAHKAGMSVRTVYRRMADPEFQAQVNEVRADMQRRAAAMLTAAAMAAIKTFTTLQESAQSESVRLGAARSIIELGCKLREMVEITERLAQLEARMAAEPADAAKLDRQPTA